MSNDEQSKPMLTLDDFFRRVIETKAKQGNHMALVMLEAHTLIKAGKMTPELAKELARKAVPDVQ